MISFLISILAILIGYLFYSKYVEKKFGVNPAEPTPAYTKADGVDFMPLPTWKVFVIQFLNIAGLGPIFGAILGAAYGPVAYLWIVFGCIFFGAVHDFFSGVASLNLGGATMTEITGKYVGKWMRHVMNVLLIFLLLAVGVSFVTGPVDLIHALTHYNKELCLLAIFIYYILATLLPIDKIIGTIYPFMGAALLFMAIGVGMVMLVGDINGVHSIPELTPESFKNYHSDPESNIIVPMLFIVISCGAISGFHSTQSPLMARCLKNKKHARPIFYGAMAAEGIVAMIWATAAMTFFGGPEGLNAAATNGVEIGGEIVKVTPAIAVDMICESWLGKVGAVIAIIGVVVCPITSGDTAFRSLRLTLAEMIKLDQKPILKRLLICVPIFAIAFFLCKMDFSTIWNYVGIANQTLATLVLWTAVAYLIHNGKSHWFCSIPATFLTFICVSYFIVAPHKNGGLFLSTTLGYSIGAAIALIVLAVVIIKTRNKSMPEKDFNDLSK